MPHSPLTPSPAGAISCDESGRMGAMADDHRDEECEVERQSLQQRKRHWTMLLVSLGIMGLAFLMRIGGSGQVSFAGFSRYPLPELCGSRLMFGTECPGCGLTRSFLALAAGDWRQSFEYHRMGWILATAVLLQIPYRIYRLRQSATRSAGSAWPQWFGNLLIALLLCNWLAKLCLGQ